MTETLHIYLRVSSETQSADGFGLAVQKEWGENLSGVLGFTPKIHDEGAASSSNDSLEKRPVLLSLLDQMDREEIKHLYVYNTDRLSRNQQTWGLIRTKILTNKVLLYTGRDPNPIDTNDPIQNMLMGILSEFSQYDNTIRKMRLTSGKFQKIKNGGWMGGPTPFGYQNIDGKLEIHPTESEWVKRIFEDYLDGGSTTDIRNTLLKNGVRTRRGNARFSLGSIRSILTNTHYNGSYVVHNKMSDEIITCSCPPILPPKTYSAVQQMYEERSYNRKGRAKEGREVSNYLSKEFLVCGHCGSKFGVKNNPNQYRNHYYCRGNANDWNSNGEKNPLPCKERVRSIKVDQTDKIIWESICDILENSHTFRESFKEEVEKKEMTKKKSAQQTKVLNKKIKILKSEIAKVTNFKLNYKGIGILKGDSEEEIRATLQTFEDDITNNRIELEELENQKKGITDKSNWIDWVSKFNDNIDDWRTGANLIFEEKQNVLRNLVQSINVVSDDKTTHKLVINLSVHYWLDSLNWNWKKSKSGEQIKDGYWIGKGEDIFITQSIYTKKNKME